MLPWGWLSWPAGHSLLSSVPLLVFSLLLLLFLLLLLLLFSVRRPNHWSRLGVYHRADHFPLGARGAAALLDSYPAALRQEYEEVRSAGGLLPHLDMAAGPAVTISDLSLVHRVMTADFTSFSDRRPPAPRTSVLSNMMMNLPADEWRPLRDTLAPAFSAARLRRVAPLCRERARRLAAQALKEAAAAGGDGVEMETLFQRYTLDTISAVAFGIEAQAIENPGGQLARRARGLVWRPPPWRVLLRAAAGRLGLARWLSAAPSLAGEAISFFAELTLEAAWRRRAGGGRRDDALQLLLEHRSETGEPLSDRQLAAQGAMLLLGGYGNTAAALAWSARCLARHPAVQARLYRELEQQRAQETADVTELLERLPYLDRVVREVLRMYPAATPQLARCATTPYQFPSGLQLPLHCAVFIPVLGIHHDPDLYPDPDRFQPDRFREETRWSRPAAAWLPFGLGPRGCPGTRLALMELKLALLELLTSCQLRLCARSGAAQPRFVPGAGVMREQGGTLVEILPRLRAVPPHGD